MVVFMEWELYKGDCFDHLSQIKNESVDLIITDPPYFINYKTNYRINKKHDFCNPIKNDTSPKILKKLIPELYRILKDNSALYIFCSPDTIGVFKKEVQKYFKIKNIIIWVKNNHTAGDLKAQYGKKYEMIIYANRGRSFINGKRLTDVWEFDRVSGKRQLHQNQKPLDLVEQIIKKSSNEHDVVLDCFAGSGTTGVACMNLNRDCIMMELENEYCDIILKRMAENDQKRLI